MSSFNDNINKAIETCINNVMNSYINEFLNKIKNKIDDEEKITKSEITNVWKTLMGGFNPSIRKKKMPTCDDETCKHIITRKGENRQCVDIVCKNSKTKNYCSKHYKSHENPKVETHCEHKKRDGDLCGKKTTNEKKYCSAHNKGKNKSTSKHTEEKSSNKESKNTKDEKPSKKKSNEPKVNFDTVVLKRIRSGKFIGMYSFEINDTVFIYDKEESIIQGSTDNDFEEIYELSDEEIEMFKGSKFKTEQKEEKESSSKSTSNKSEKRKTKSG